MSDNGLMEDTQARIRAGAERFRGRTMEEEATGISASPGRQLYARGGTKLDDEAAAEALRRGETVEAPWAGASSYRDVFERLGFKIGTVIDQCSSAGDWSMLVQNEADELFYVACQFNRHPRCGFSYAVDTQRVFGSEEEMLATFEA